MPHFIFYIIAVIIGCLIFISILINFLRNIPASNNVFSTALVFSALVLVSSPLWSAIYVKAHNIEVNFVKETFQSNSKKQIENYLALAELLKSHLNPEQKLAIEPHLRKVEESYDRIISKTKSLEETREIVINANDAVSGTTKRFENITKFLR